MSMGLIVKVTKKETEDGEAIVRMTLRAPERIMNKLDKIASKSKIKTTRNKLIIAILEKALSDKKFEVEIE